MIWLLVVNLAPVHVSATSTPLARPVCTFPAKYDYRLGDTRRKCSVA
jgi:hypothetical protein